MSKSPNEATGTAGRQARNAGSTTATEPTLLITADDRTGALETGGACADLGFRVRFGPNPVAGDACALLDIDSRHTSPQVAGERVVRAHSHRARFRCHKMDSGLRGNWAHEVAALLASGRRIGVLASFPDAGRQCVDGTVLVRGVPVADSAFGRDPRSRVTSSRPRDHLIDAGCAAALASGELRIFDAGDNAELAAASASCRRDDRMLVGTTGAIGAYLAPLLAAPRGRTRPRPLPRPALVVCGSLHPVSRTQIAVLPGRALGMDDHIAISKALRDGKDVVVATPLTTAEIDDETATETAAELAKRVWMWLAETSAPSVVILGGDTAAAVLGDRPLRVFGSIATGLPVCATEDGRLTVVTKGGSIGEPETLVRMLAHGGIGGS